MPKNCFECLLAVSSTRLSLLSTQNSCVFWVEEWNSPPFTIVFAHFVSYFFRFRSVFLQTPIFERVWEAESVQFARNQPLKGSPCGLVCVSAQASWHCVDVRKPFGRLELLDAAEDDSFEAVRGQLCVWRRLFEGRSMLLPLSSCLLWAW